MKLTFDLGKLRFGFTSETIGRPECPYLHRKILWLGLCTLRYHVFYRSDEERALHDHPWAFITFPLSKYYEYVPLPNQPYIRRKVVLPFRFHFRPATYRHRVVLPDNTVAFLIARFYGASDEEARVVANEKCKPVRTLVLGLRKKRSWGFWKDGHFFPWRDWFRVMGMPPCADEQETR